MAYSMQQAQAETEIWLNTSPGVRWYKALDLYGRETTKTVQGGKTFTVTVFERQLNQAAVATPEQDLFRNGTFALRKASEQTVSEEVRSTNSLTEAEVSGLAMELMHGQGTVDEALDGIDSNITLDRILEALVLEDADSDLIAQVKARKTPEATPKASPPPSEPAYTKPEEEEEQPVPVPEPAATTQPEVEDEDEDEFDSVPGEPVTAELKE